MSLSTFTLLCDHHQNHSLQNFFCLAKLKLCSHQTIAPYSTFLSTSSNHHSIFWCYEFDYSGYLKWNHTILVLLCPAYFTYHNVLKAHACYSMYQNVLLLKAEKYPIVCIYPNLFNPFIC